MRVPSWCDRILVRSRNKTNVVYKSWCCNDDLMTSDHAPVMSEFDVIVDPYVMPTTDEINAVLSGTVKKLKMLSLSGVLLY